ARASGTSAAQRLDRGVARADEAIERLTWSWPPGAYRPFATLAALLLDGARAWIVHIGACRVSRITRAGLVPLTVDHTIGHELRAAAPPVEMAHILTRHLGAGAPPRHELQQIEIAGGDRFLLGCQDLHRRLDDDAISACWQTAER